MDRTDRLSDLSLLRRIACGFPLFKPAKKRMDIRPTVIHQFDRRTGARRFVRSGAIGYDRFVFGNGSDALVNFVEREPNGSFNLTF